MLQRKALNAVLLILLAMPGHAAELVALVTELGKLSLSLRSIATSGVPASWSTRAPTTN